MDDHSFEESVIYRFVGGLDAGWRRGELADYAIALSDLNDPVLIMRDLPEGRIYLGNERVLATARMDDVVRNFYLTERAAAENATKLFGLDAPSVPDASTDSSAPLETGKLQTQTPWLKIFRRKTPADHA
jgi:hypothetical protein